MSDQSKFKDEEIRDHLRQTNSRRKNVDYDQLQARRDLLFAARTDTPEEFQARLTNRGIDLGSEQGRKVMEAYWTIRRELQR
jgi:hypothetical protein